MISVLFKLLIKIHFTDQSSALQNISDLLNNNSLFVLMVLVFWEGLNSFIKFGAKLVQNERCVKCSINMHKRVKRNLNHSSVPLLKIGFIKAHFLNFLSNYVDSTFLSFTKVLNKLIKMLQITSYPFTP